MPDSKPKPHDGDVDFKEEFKEEEAIPEVTVDVSNLTPTSFEVISKQVRCPNHFVLWNTV